MSDLHINAQEFDEKVKRSPQPVAVDFYADWCGPCKMMAPLIEKLAEDYRGRARVFKINTDNAQQIATEFGIRGIPTVVFFKGGKESSRVVGFVPYEKLTSSLDGLL
ncbi:MAG: thioredoxin [bacterium]